MNKKRLELLYRSFDRELGAGEKEELARALSEDPKLRQEKERLRVLRRSLAESAVTRFRPFFAERVINRLRAPAARDSFDRALSRVFRRVVLVGAIAALALITINLFSDRLPALDVSAAQSVTLEEAYLSTFTPSWEEML